MKYLIVGASGSGKSEYAESIVMSMPRPIYYVATMNAYGIEGAQRVARHQKLRQGKGFLTIEAPDHIYQTVMQHTMPGQKSLIIECMSNLLANEMFCEEGCDLTAYDRIVADLKRLYQEVEHIVIVSNDIFSDGIEYDESTNAYLTQLGHLNQIMASWSDACVEVVYGIPIIHKGKEYVTNQLR